MFYDVVVIIFYPRCLKWRFCSSRSEPAMTKKR